VTNTFWAARTTFGKHTVEPLSPNGDHTPVTPLSTHSLPIAFTILAAAVIVRSGAVQVVASA
jgi:hypothetical protein